jgi:MFS family permease
LTVDQPLSVERPIGESPEKRGMTTFLVVWAGQVVSSLGSYLTGFALAVWIYQQTSSATYFGLITLATTLPGILLSPVAGALVDRWDRRLVMIVADAGSALATLALALLIWKGHLALWHIFVLLPIISCFSTFTWPAFNASTSLLVPSRHLGRAAGMTQMGDAAASLVAPLLAGILIVSIGRQGVVLIDFASYLVAIAALLGVRMPRPAATSEGTASRGSIWREARWGWTFIRQRPGLLALLLMMAATNIGMGILQVLLSPMILSFASPVVLGRVLSAAGLGVLAGGLLMSVWGGPRRRVFGMLGALFAEGLILPLGGLRASALLISIAAVAYMVTVPILNGCGQAIWQSRVPPDLQGRVFAVRRMVAWSTLPFAYLIAGPLADHVFEPLMRTGGPLAASVGLVLGVGKGRGMGLMLIVIGLFTLLVATVASRFPRLVHLEDELPNVLTDPASG